MNNVANGLDQQLNQKTASSRHQREQTELSVGPVPDSVRVCGWLPGVAPTSYPANKVTEKPSCAGLRTLGA